MLHWTVSAIHGTLDNQGLKLTNVIVEIKYWISINKKVALGSLLFDNIIITHLE